MFVYKEKNRQSQIQTNQNQFINQPPRFYLNLMCHAFFVQDPGNPAPFWMEKDEK